MSKIAGKRTKRYPRFRSEIGDISLNLFPQVAGGFALLPYAATLCGTQRTENLRLEIAFRLLPLDCRCCPLRLNSSMWCHAVRSRFVSFESFANQDVIRSRRGWLSDSSHWISPTCANAQLRFTTPRFARGNSGGWLDAIESTEKPDCLVAALGDSVDSRCTSNYSPWSL